MPDQFSHVATAAGILNSSVGTARERIVDCGSEFWRAMAHLGTWPPDLLKKAKHIGTGLLWNGFPVEGAMPTAASGNTLNTTGGWATEIANDMANLAVDIEQARTEKRLPKQLDGYRKAEWSERYGNHVEESHPPPRTAQRV